MSEEQENLDKVMCDRCEKLFDENDLYYLENLDKNVCITCITLKELQEADND